MTALLNVLKTMQKKDDDRSPFVQVLAQFPKALSGWVDKWPEAGTDNTVIRCSGAYELCPREFVLDYWKPTGKRVFPFTNQLFAGMGTWVHSYLQNIILGPLGLLKGKWKHIRENGNGLVHTGYYPDSAGFYDKYLKTGEYDWEYVENVVWEPHYRFSGHQDGLIDKHKFVKFVELMNLDVSFDTIRRELSKVPETEACALEIKNTGNRNFEQVSLQNLPPYYRMQACLYQKLCNVHETLFWYINRDNCESKLFSYQFEQDWWNEATRKANCVWTSIRDETLPENMMKCLTSTDKRAKICPHAKQCWSKIQFKDWLQKQKESQPDRKFLDLSGYTV